MKKLPFHSKSAQHLLLHLRGHGLALLHEVAHELVGLIHIGHRAERGQGARAEFALQIGEGLHVFLEHAAHEALHGVAIEADHVGERGFTKHGHAAAFFFQNDLEQDGAGEVFIRFRIAYSECFAIDDQLLDFSERDVGGADGVIQAAIGVFFDDAQFRRCC